MCRRVVAPVYTHMECTMQDAGYRVRGAGEAHLQTEAEACGHQSRMRVAVHPQLTLDTQWRRQTGDELCDICGDG